MEVTRSFVSTCPNPPNLRIPKICYDARTIYVNQMDILHLCKDRREVARQFLEALLPLLAPLLHKDALLTAFWKTPDNSWFEFDYTTKVLSYCFLEK